MIFVILTAGGLVFIASYFWERNATFVQEEKTAATAINADTDNDGFKDWEEWLLQMDPRTQDATGKPLVQKIPTTQESLKQYGNALANILKRYEFVTAEKTVAELTRLLASDTPEPKDTLETIAAGYYTIVAEMGTIPVPEKVYEAHLRIMENMQTTAGSVKHMQTIAENAEEGVAGLSIYIEALESTTKLFAELYDVLAKYEINFTESESGYLWHKFKDFKMN